MNESQIILVITVKVRCVAGVGPSCSGVYWTDDPATGRTGRPSLRFDDGFMPAAQKLSAHFMSTVD